MKAFTSFEAARAYWTVQGGILNVWQPSSAGGATWEVGEPDEYVAAGYASNDFASMIEHALAWGAHTAKGE